MTLANRLVSVAAQWMRQQQPLPHIAANANKRAIGPTNAKMSACEIPPQFFNPLLLEQQFALV
jgi:hypothetical protein